MKTERHLFPYHGNTTDVSIIYVTSEERTSQQMGGKAKANDELGASSNAHSPDSPPHAHCLQPTLFGPRAWVLGTSDVPVVVGLTATTCLCIAMCLFLQTMTVKLQPRLNTQNAMYQHFLGSQDTQTQQGVTELHRLSPPISVEPLWKPNFGEIYQQNLPFYHLQKTAPLVPFHIL